MARHARSWLVAALLLSACAEPPAVAAAALPSHGQGWREVAPPANGTAVRGQWIEIDAPNGRRLLTNVLRPPGPGPFPVVVSLHSSAGFAQPAITGLGYDLVAAGFMVVSGCWFALVAPTRVRLQPLFDCPNGPPFGSASLASIDYARALVATARSLPAADPRRIGLTGQSRGANAAVLLASTGAGVQAVVSDSASYTRSTAPNTRDTPPITMVSSLAAPLLILHGTADSAARVEEARAYEGALRELGKPYEVRYYEGGEHVLQRRNNASYPDALARTVAFFRMHLAP